MMITIKEYATERGISYEAGRKCLRRYEDELSGHLSRDDRSVLLDDEAVKFLDERREAKKGGSAGAEAGKKPKRKDCVSGTSDIGRLREENRALRDKSCSLKGKLAEMDAVKVENRMLRKELSALQEANGPSRSQDAQDGMELSIENRVLKERMEGLKEALKREEEKTVRLEAERVQLMSDDWAKFGKNDIIKNGGRLVRHHFNALARYENPPLETVFDVLSVMPDGKGDGMVMAGYMKIDVSDAGPGGRFDGAKILKSLGKEEQSGRPLLSIMPGHVWADRIADMYGPLQCRGEARDGRPLTAENILITEKEAEEWMEDIGAEEFIPCGRTA